MSTLEQEEYKKVEHKLKEFDTHEFVGTGAWKVTKGGNTLKLRFLEKVDGATELHKVLLKDRVIVPEILKIDTDDKGSYKITEWWPGVTFRELIDKNKIEPYHYGELGFFAAIVGSIEGGMKTLGFENYLPKNLLHCEAGEVKNEKRTVSIVCDLNKLMASFFPENTIIRYILTEDLVDSPTKTFTLRNEFLEGYRIVKQFDLRNVLRKQVGYCTDKNRDIYVIPELMSELPEHGKPGKTGYSITDVTRRELIHVGKDDVVGKITNLEEQGLPKDLTGKEVLELNFNAGMISFECMLRGASYVYGCDVYHQQEEGSREIFKASDIGKFIAYLHGFDGRDLHYKYINTDSLHFVDHLKNMNRTFDYIILNDVRESMSPEVLKAFDEYLTTTKAKVLK